MPMNNELNHECIVCGVKYHHCDSCANMRSFTPWRVICDTELHYQIYMVIIGYRDNLITKEKAKDELNNIDITINDISNFKDSIQVFLKDILSDEDTENVNNNDDVSDIN